MADRAGYIFIEEAISPELAKKGADAVVKGLTVKEKLEKVTEFVVPPVGEDIKNAFLENKNNKTRLSELVHPGKVPLTVQSTGVGIFNKSNADPNKPKTLHNDVSVYVTIALTDLSPSNGWFILLEGSHERTGAASSANWKQISLSLKAGDAVAWRGSLAYLHSSGGGGMFETLVLA